jgi:HAE1 family hydrophobic/amphiphilic exporter-1
LDSDRLAAHNLAGIDALRALEGQNVNSQTIAMPPIGGAFCFTITAGQLPELKKIEDAVIKTTENGRAIRLRDVARLERGADHSRFATLDSKPAVT